MFENWNYEAVMQNVEQAFRIMGQGMLGIFVVIGLIALVVVVLSKITGNSSRKDMK